MRVTAVEESVIRDIGHAFGYYDYGGEHGLIDAFPSREAAAAFIRGYVRMALESGTLYSVGENGEGWIAYQLPGQKVPLRAMLPLARGLLGFLRPGELLRFAGIMSQGGPGLERKLRLEGKPYLSVGLLCVREPYQGKGFMRKALSLAFAEGDRLGVPVILETDAVSKRDRYLHLGMELSGTRRFGDHGVLYDLIRYPTHGSGGP